MGSDLKQGDSASEVIICFVTKFNLSVDLIQLLKVITVRGFTLNYDTVINCSWNSKCLRNFRCM